MPKQIELVPDTLICQNCGIEFPMNATARFRYKRGNPQKFCTNPCYHAAKKAKVEITCQLCGKVVEVYKKYVERGQYKYCSTDCRKKAFKKGVTDQERQRTCRSCGKQFLISPGEVLARKQRYHCSKACQRKRDRKDCEWCGIEFEFKSAYSSKRRYCSRECYMKSRLPSRLEMLVEYVLREEKLGYEREHRIGQFVVDFVLPDLGIAIEADGEYWHDKAERWETRAKKEAAISAAGWTLVRLPQLKVERQAEIEVLGSILRAIQAAKSLSKSPD